MHGVSLFLNYVHKKWTSWWKMYRTQECKPEIIRYTEIWNTLLRHSMFYCPLSFYNPITKWRIKGHIFWTKTLISHKIKVIEQNKKKGFKKTCCNFWTIQKYVQYLLYFWRLSTFWYQGTSSKDPSFRCHISIFLIISGSNNIVNLYDASWFLISMLYTIHYNNPFQ